MTLDVLCRLNNLEHYAILSLVDNNTEATASFLQSLTGFLTLTSLKYDNNF